MGRHTFDHSTEENNLLDVTCTPACLDLERLPGLSIHQIVFLDEVHKKIEIGKIGDIMVSFPQDKEVLFDENRTIVDVEFKLHMKYDMEGSLQFWSCCGETVWWNFGRTLL
jgi:hypothetical protein